MTLSRLKATLLTKRNLLMVAIFFFIFSLLTVRYLGSESIGGYEADERICLEFLEQGTLYGGQPFCVQGPVLYGVGYLLKFFFGATHLQTSAKILHGIVMAASFLLFLFVFFKETSHRPFLIPLVLFLAFIWYPSLGYLEMALSVFFSLGGYFLLFHSSWRQKELYAGICFSLSLLTKLSSAYLIMGIFLLQGLDLYKRSETLFKKIKSFGVLSFATFLPSIIFFLSFPLAFKILVLGPRIIMQEVSGGFLSYFTATSHFFSWQEIHQSPYHFSLLLLLALNFYGLLRYRKRIFLLVIPAFFTLLEIKRVVLSLSSETGYYFLPLIPFLLVGMGVLFFQEKKVAISLIAVMGLLVVSSYVLFQGDASLEIASLWEENRETGLEKFRKIIEKPIYQHLPPQKNKVLTTTAFSQRGWEARNDYLAWLSPETINNAESVIDPNRTEIDLSTWSKISEFIGGEEAITRWMQQLITSTNLSYSEQVTIYSQNLFRGEYDLIIIAPPYIEPLKGAVIQKVDYFVQNLSYFPVYIPFLKYAHDKKSNQKILAMLLFKNQSQGEEVLSFMQWHFKFFFEYLCQQSESLTNFISFAMQVQGRDLGKECESSAERMGKPKSGSEVRNVLSLMVIFVLFFFKKIKSE